MAREHYLVVRNPEPDAVNWALLVGSGNPMTFKTLGSGATKAVWVAEAVKLAIAGNLSCDLTISDADPASVIESPDSAPDKFSLLVICPEGLPSSGRWVVLSLRPDGEFRKVQVVVNVAAHWFLESLAGDAKEGPYSREIIWLRPDMRAEDLLPAKVEP